MEFYRCMNHPEQPSVAQCNRCGKPICEQCYDPETGRCRYQCGEILKHHGSPMTNQPDQPKSALWTIVVSLLAVFGGLFLLLITICGAMFFSY